MSKLKNTFPTALNGHNLKIILLWILPLLLLLQIPGFLEFKKCLDAGHTPCTGEAGIIAQALYFIGPLIILLLLKWRRRIPWSDLGFGETKSSAKQTAILVAGGIGLSIAVQVAIGLLGSKFPNLREQQFIFDPGNNMWLFAIMAIVLAPIIEEIFFRGFEFSILGRKFGVVAGALISSISFGVIHGQINAIIFATIFGLYLCYLYRKTGSLIPGIGLHALNNALATAALILLKK